LGDLFNDGHIDVVLNNIDAPPALLRNVVNNSNHWLTLKLVGGPKSPRDAIGSKVFLTSGGIRQRADVSAAQVTPQVPIRVSISDWGLRPRSTNWKFIG